MTLWDAWLLLMGIVGIFIGTSFIFTRKVTTIAGIVGNRIVFTGRVAQVFGIVQILAGVGILLIVADILMLNFIVVIFVFAFGGMVICSLLQSIQDRRYNRH
mgnify:CR=1 FL=1